MNNKENDLRPQKRSKLRLALGKIYYRLARYCYWYFGGLKFAKKQDSPSPVKMYSVFTHQTPLLRSLKDVDMQYQYNKVTNLKIASAKVDGVVIHPGETFSYWKLIGEPTRKKGYLEGIVLFCGTFHPGVGGGLCQLSNLIFWMTLHTPLTVVERYRHSYDVFPDSNRTQPFGSGATCVYPYRDLMIRNDTDMDFVLSVKVGETHLEGEWKASQKPTYTYHVIEKDHILKGEMWGGYSRHNALYREVIDYKGDVVDEEYITENHALMMYNPFLEYKGNVNVTTEQAE